MKMQLHITFCLLSLTCFALSNTDDPGLIGYARMAASKADPNLCTHLIYSSVSITEDGNVSVVNPKLDLPDNGGKAGFQKMNALRKRNGRLKTFLSCGSWTTEAPVFSKIAANTTLRSKYAKNVVDFLLHHEFDGLHVRWAWPTLNGGIPEDVQNYVLLLEEFRANFDDHKLILIASHTGIEINAAGAYDIPQISKHLDFILLDMICHVPSEATTDNNAPLYPASREISALDRSRNIDSAIRYWREEGAPAKKLILITSSFGLGFNLSKPTEHVPGSPAIPNEGKIDEAFSFPSYTEICVLTSRKGWISEWDEEQRVPYSYSGNWWISYDNVRSAMEKAEYVRDMGLGGIAIRTIDWDDPTGECGERSPLLNALNRALRDNRSLSVQESDIATASKADLDDRLREDAKKACAKVNTRYVRDPQNCAMFWLCRKIGDSVFNPKLFSCGDGLYFDTDINSCQSSKLVKCN